MWGSLLGMWMAFKMWAPKPPWFQDNAPLASLFPADAGLEAILAGQEAPPTPACDNCGQDSTLHCRHCGNLCAECDQVVHSPSVTRPFSILCTKY